MSIRTIYTCDKCGSEQVKPDQFWVIGIGVQGLTTHPDMRYNMIKDKSMQVCQSCLESLVGHASKREIPADSPQSVPPTTEELIHNLLDHLGVMRE